MCFWFVGGEGYLGKDFFECGGETGMERRFIGRGYGSIMVLVPHQDDEILLCAGIMERAAANGVPLTVVMVTNGDYGSEDLSVGQARLRETLEGLKVLGVPESQVVFLGFADTGMPKEDSFLYRLYEEGDGRRVHPSCCGVCTYGLPEKEEFHKAEYGEHGAYTRDVFLGDLRAVLLKYRPEHIFTTSKEDTHGDHSGLFLFVQEVLEECRKEGYVPRLYSGLVHSRAGDENWPERGGGMIALDSPEHAAGLRDEEAAGEGEGILGSLVWEERIVFPVPDSMRKECRKECPTKCPTECRTECPAIYPSKCLEKNRKALALSKHVTALKPDAVDFLYAFVKEDEVFWEINW